jgi:hypothetical protein
VPSFDGTSKGKGKGKDKDDNNTWCGLGGGAMRRFRLLFFGRPNWLVVFGFL